MFLVACFQGEAVNNNHLTNLLSFGKGDIADISHHRHHRQWLVVYFFQVGAHFSTENAKFWPGLAILGYFVTNLRTLWCPCKSLDSLVVYYVFLI